MAFSEYGNYDAMGLAELVRKKKVTAANCLTRRSPGPLRSIRRSMQSS